jgi:hypothetical protein
MWRQVSLVGPYFAQQFSPQPAPEGVEAHSHSPRHSGMLRPPPGIANIASVLPPNQNIFPRQPTYDPFTEPLHAALDGWRQTSSTDISMPDLSNSNTRASSSRQVSDPVIVSGKSERRFESMQMPGAYESICEALLPSAPVNTPQNGGATPVKAPGLQSVTTAIKCEPITTGRESSKQSGKRRAETTSSMYYFFRVGAEP